MFSSTPEEEKPQIGLTMTGPVMRTAQWLHASSNLLR